MAKSDDPWHRYLVVTRDGSREEVVAQGYDFSFDHEAQASILKLEPHSTYRATSRAGEFVDAQGIHMIEVDVPEPEGVYEEDEDAD